MRPRRPGRPACATCAWAVFSAASANATTNQDTAMSDIFQGSGAPLTATGVADALNKLQAPTGEPSLWSVITVETRGFGYLPDRRPKILFERHVFHQRPKGAFDAAHPDISHPGAGGYSGGASEYLRLERAMRLDRKHALESASWGLGQVMGFNAASLGYADVDAMIAAFKSSEDAQLDGCVRFIASKPDLLAAFRGKDWARVAFFYNGRDYARNAYDRKLRDFEARFAQTGVPNVGARAAQARLSYLGYDTKGIDGLIGPATTAALRAFQAKQKLKVVNGQLTPETGQALIDATGV
jgi:hypothetical protein